MFGHNCKDEIQFSQSFASPLSSQIDVVEPEFNTSESVRAYMRFLVHAITS